MNYGPPPVTEIYRVLLFFKCRVRTVHCHESSGVAVFTLSFPSFLKKACFAGQGEKEKAGLGGNFSYFYEKRFSAGSFEG